MTISVFKGIRVRGIAAAVPEQRVNNLTAHRFCPEETRRKIVELTGVTEYRKAPPTMCSSDLCEAAARKLLDDLDVDPATIDAVVFATMTPDYRIPSTACILQAKLDCTSESVAYDINMGCSGFVVGLYNACALINGAGLKRVLLLAGDTQTRLCHEEDKNVVFLMGDGGSACLVEVEEDRVNAIAAEIFTDGSRFDKLYVPAGGFRHPSSGSTRRVRQHPDGGMRADDNIYMDGMELFKFSSTDVVKSLRSFMEHEHLSAENVDFLILHQANKFMTDKIARKLSFGPEKVPYSLGTFGNTGSASIPLTIACEYDRVASSGTSRCLLCGFGVGLSWGIVDIDLGGIYCPPVIECA